MVWSIVQFPEHANPFGDGLVREAPRKVFIDCQDKTNYSQRKVTLFDQQPLQNADTLSLELLKEVILVIQEKEIPVFLMRGIPENPDQYGQYTLDDSCWRDCGSRQHQLDLDFHTDLIQQYASRSERVGVALESLPFVNGKRFLAQLSSGAGLPAVWAGKKMKDYPSRLNLRLWMETEEPITAHELRQHYQEYIDTGLLDGGMFEATRRHYVMQPELENTPCELEDSTDLAIYAGEALTIDSLNLEKPNLSSMKKPDPKSKAAPTIVDEARQQRINAYKKVIYTSNREHLIQNLAELAKTVPMDGIRNEIFPLLFQRETFFGGAHIPFMIDNMIKHEDLVGDRDKKNLTAISNWADKKLLKRIRMDAADYAIKNAWKIKRLSYLNLADNDWSELFKHKFVALRSDCGTNKSKGVLAEVIAEANKHDAGVLILTPLVSCTEQLANHLGIAHYHKYGEEQAGKRRAIDSEQHLVMCYQSLQLMSPRERNELRKHYQYICVDEASQVTRSWTDPTDFQREIEILFDLMDAATEQVMFLCADIDSHTLWCLEQIENFDVESAVLYMNDASWMRDATVFDYQRTEEFLEDVIASLKAGKRVALFTTMKDDKGGLEALSKFLQEHTELADSQLRWYDTKQSRQAPELRYRPNETLARWILEDDLRLFIASPWATVGWDFLHDDAHFDESCVLDSLGCYSAQKMKQQVRRMRTSRIARICSAAQTSLPIEDKLKKILEEEKGIKFSQMPRIDRWAVKAWEAQDLDLAQPQRQRKSVFEECGAAFNIVEAKTVEEGKHTLPLLTDELDAIRKSFKEAYLQEKQSELYERLKIQRSFGYIRNETFCEIPDHILEHMPLKDFAYLLSRDEKINAQEAERLTQIYSLDEEERREWDQLEQIKFHVGVGKLFDAFTRDIEKLLDWEQFFSFAHWYAYAEDGASIYGLVDEDLDLDAYQMILNRHWKSIQLNIKGVGRDAIEEPARIVVPVARALDLGITTKNTFDKLIAAGEIPKNRKVSAPKAKAALYKEMNQNKPEGWAYCKTDSDKRSFCISSIKAKNGKEKLTRAEEDFIWSRPTSFRLYRKTPASKVWHELMVRAAKEQEDREGIAENHTRHCMCVECTEFAL